MHAGRWLHTCVVQHEVMEIAGCLSQPHGWLLLLKIAATRQQAVPAADVRQVAAIST
jgi:hypothetical protein